MVTSSVIVVVSLVRLRRNGWKDRSVGGGKTDYTNLIIGILCIGFGIWMLVS